MILIHLNKPSKSRISGTLISFLLTILLVACGANPTTNSSATRPHPSTTANKSMKTPTATPSISPTVFDLNTTKTTEDVGSLHIQSDFGFQCSFSIDEGSLLAQFQYPVGQLVLSSNRTTYSQEEIAQMRDYVDTNPSAWKFLSEGKTPPPTLRWVMGGSVDAIPGTPPAYPCGADLNLTNTGNTPIQIPQVGARLEGHPQQNSYSYHLIDSCTTAMPRPQAASCTHGEGGYPGCAVYTASIQLGLGKKNDVYSAVPSALGCDSLTIAPAAQIDLFFDFSLAPNIPRNLIYSITPTLTVNTAQGTQTVLLSKMVSTLAFANVTQFSCYGLQGTTFALEQSPVYSTKNVDCM